MYTRREIGKLALASIPLSAAFAAVPEKINGVSFGVAAYSYFTLPRQGILDVVIASMLDMGVGDCLLLTQFVEPVELADKARPARGGGGGAPRGASGGQGRGPGGGGGGRGPVSPEQAAAVEALRQWHLTVSPDYYTGIRKKFADAGLTIHSYEPSFSTNPTDEDLNRACEDTKGLGADCMMCVVGRSVARRLAPFAEKHSLRVAFQGRPNLNSTDPEAMAKPADFEEAMSYSKNFGSSIDVGDATGAGWDVLKFIQDTHERVFGLNLKDRTKDNVSMPWGQGDTRIKDILQLVRNRKYPVRCYIDCDFVTAPETTRVADVKRCAEFARAALA